MDLKEIKRNFEMEKDEPVDRKDFDSFGEEIWFLGFYEDEEGVYLICHEDDIATVSQISFLSR